MSVDLIALEDSYTRRSRQLWALARRIGLEANLAEEVVQEAFAKALNGGAVDVQNLDAWLFRVVHNLAVDSLRRRTTPSVIVNWHESNVDDRIALWQAVDRLPLRQRVVVQLHYRSDLDFATIASILGITEGGARANCARAVASLRRTMGE